MFSENLDQTIFLLENQELANNSSLSSQNYAELLAGYLYKDDLCSARYLWMRIPPKIKSGNKELEKLWAVFNCLFENDLNALHKAIKFEWSANVSNIIAELKERVREQTITLIGNAYSSIYEDRLCEMLNQTPEEILEICKRLEWEVQDGLPQKLIIPQKIRKQKNVTATAESQLSKLTDFISFLEK